MFTMTLSRRHAILGSCVASSLFALACSQTTPPPEAPTGLLSSGAPNAAERRVAITPDQPGKGGACSLQTVYFGYDDDQLDQRARDALGAAVSCYNHGGMPAEIFLAGATDPRGTEEYNLALGERRARSVQRYLSALGVAASRISVSSVGEERARGQDEAGWAEDRQVAATVR